ncbi:MAG: DivIVA domain-containing protein [Rhodoluna sp.]|nr:DivIVA domain-containing protein [Rhodoluna sp.]
MSFTFPKSKRRGYEPEAVDAFIAKAREQYSHRDANIITSLDLRQAEFPMIRKGYSVSAVDGAIDRLEDAFAKAEIDRKRAAGGYDALRDRIVAIKLLLKGRLDRPKRQHFSSTGLILRGYDRKQVDRFMASVAAHIETGRELDLNSVRRAVFKVKRGGYAEIQVDAFIDRVVELLHIERYS